MTTFPSRFRYLLFQLHISECTDYSFTPYSCSGCYHQYCFCQEEGIYSQNMESIFSSTYIYPMRPTPADANASTWSLVPTTQLFARHSTAQSCQTSIIAHRQNGMLFQKTLCQSQPLFRRILRHMTGKTSGCTLQTTATVHLQQQLSGWTEIDTAHLNAARIAACTTSVGFFALLTFLQRKRRSKQSDTIQLDRISVGHHPGHPTCQQLQYPLHFHRIESRIIGHKPCQFVRSATAVDNHSRIKQGLTCMMEVVHLLHNILG